MPVKLRFRCKTQGLLSAYAVKGYLMKVQQEFMFARLQLRNKKIPSLLMSLNKINAFIKRNLLIRDVSKEELFD